MPPRAGRRRGRRTPRAQRPTARRRRGFAAAARARRGRTHAGLGGRLEVVPQQARGRAHAVEQVRVAVQRLARRQWSCGQLGKELLVLGRRELVEQRLHVVLRGERAVVVGERLVDRSQTHACHCCIDRPFFLDVAPEDDRVPVALLRPRVEQVRRRHDRCTSRDRMSSNRQLAPRRRSMSAHRSRHATTGDGRRCGVHASRSTTGRHSTPVRVTAAQRPVTALATSRSFCGVGEAAASSGLVLDLTDPLARTENVRPTSSMCTAARRSARTGSSTRRSRWLSAQTSATPRRATRIGGLVRQRHVLVLDEVAELRLLLVADRLLERDRRLRRPADRLHLFDRHVRIVGVSTLASRALAPARSFRSDRMILFSFSRRHRHADRPRLVGERPGDGLADPPRGVRRELVALAPVELLGGAGPIVPSWIRSRNGRPWLRYRFAIETTAAGSPPPSPASRDGRRARALRELDFLPAVSSRRARCPSRRLQRVIENSGQPALRLLRRHARRRVEVTSADASSGVASSSSSTTA